MKLKYIPQVALLLVTSWTAINAQKSVFTFPFENAYRLPSMEMYINMEELSNTYLTVGDVFTTEITGYDEHKMEQTSMSFISDARVTDAARFLEFYMDEQLVAPGDGSAGQIEMSIIYFREHNRINVGTVIGVLTFGLGTLFGIPYSTAITDLEVEASIFDARDQKVATHRGVGRGRMLLTLYNSSTRIANQRALRKSLEDLNASIMADPDLTFIQR